MAWALGLGTWAAVLVLSAASLGAQEKKSVKAGVYTEIGRAHV